MRRKKPPGKQANAFFYRFSQRTAAVMGSAWIFLFAFLCIVVWAATGPLLHYSDAWQLVINTATNLVTFLMVFIIQNSQNRDSKAIHLKLDELIRAVNGARNKLVSLENYTDEELDALEKEFERVRKKAEVRDQLRGSPPVQSMSPGDPQPAETHD